MKLFPVIYFFFENLSYEINMYFKFRFFELLGNVIHGLLPMKWGVNNEIMIIIGNNVFWKNLLVKLLVSP